MSDHAPDRPVSAPSPTRVLLCLDRPAHLEQLSRGVLEHPRLRLVGRAHTLDHLHARLAATAADVAIISAQALGLPDAGAEATPAALDRLMRRVPLVVLTPTPEAPAWARLRGVALPLSATVETVLAAALALAEAGPPIARPPAAPEAAPAPRRARSAGGPAGAIAGPWLPPLPDGRRGVVLACAPASHRAGGSWLATALAAGLSRVAPTVLVDLDIPTASLLAVLPRAVTRAGGGRHNLTAMAVDAPATPADWTGTLAREVVRFPPPMDGLHVIFGVPHREARVHIQPTFVEGLVAALAARYAHVVLDVGGELDAGEGAALVHACALALADRVVLVGEADLVAIDRLRLAYAWLTGPAGVPADRVDVVLNKVGRRPVFPPPHVAEEVGAPLAAVIPEDRAHVEAAARDEARTLHVLLRDPGPAIEAALSYAEELALRLGTLTRPSRRGPLARLADRWRRRPATRPATHVELEDPAGPPAALRDTNPTADEPGAHRDDERVAVAAGPGDGLAHD